MFTSIQPGGPNYLHGENTNIHTRFSEKQAIPERRSGMLREFLSSFCGRSCLVALARVLLTSFANTGEPIVGKESSTKQRVLRVFFVALTVWFENHTKHKTQMAAFAGPQRRLVACATQFGRKFE